VDLVTKLMIDNEKEEQEKIIETKATPEVEKEKKSGFFSRFFGN
jgi:hypothetical protein